MSRLEPRHCASAPALDGLSDQKVKSITRADTLHTFLTHHEPLPESELTVLDDIDYFGYEHDSLQHSSLRRTLSVQAGSKQSEKYSQSSISSRRGLDLCLGGLQDLQVKPFPTDTESSAVDREIRIRVSPASSSICSATLSTPLLTPPDEPESPVYFGSIEGVCQQSQNVKTAATLQSDARTPIPPQISTNTHISLASIDPNLPDQQDFVQSPWLASAFSTLIEPIPADATGHNLEIVSQVLPHLAVDRRARPTYERICDSVQRGLTQSCFITITHGVTQTRIVEDFPRSPPATPSFERADDYFGELQTMHTAAARVPVYHQIGVPLLNVGSLMPEHNIVRPMKAHISILERYIPPSQAAEVDDMFDIRSGRSYLAHRLPEISPKDGTLLFIYPTRVGAQTFASKYVGPLLDPLLREMTILRGMNTNAAERLGRMQACDAMLTFEQLEVGLSEVCSSMNQRSDITRSQSWFSIVHSERTEVVLDKQTWQTWFVEQESARFKQDLVEYHQAGGNMPQASRGKYEATAGMLAREIMEKMQKSQTVSGTAGIEVGVFVVRRRASA